MPGAARGARAAPAAHVKALAVLRRLGRALLLAVVRLFPAGRGGPVPGPVRSVLVVRTDDRVGNLLLTTPLLASLRAGLPGARIGLLCAARRSPAVEGTGLYDELWRFEKRDFFRRPWRFVAFCLALRRVGYQVAIEAGHSHAFSFTGAALALWSGAAVRIGHRRGEASRFLTHAVEAQDAPIYDAAAKLALLEPLGIRATLTPLRTELGRARLEELRGLMQQALVIYPGARKLDHRWEPRGFAEAARRLADRTGLRPWIAWGPGELELAREVAAAASADLLPPTDLEGLAAAFRAASVVLTNDTGPMHLSVAAGAPTVAVFLTEDAARWASPEPHARAVQVRGMDRETAVARVVEAAAELLQGRT